MNTKCVSCGSELECPSCGGDNSDDRNPATYTLNAGCGEFVLVGHSVEVEVRQGWANLLASAQKLHEHGSYRIAVIIAQSACEVVVQRVMKDAFKAHGLPHVAGVLDRIMPTGALQASGPRKLYNAINNDDISKADCWKGYSKMVELRNDIAHHGYQPTENKSAAALITADLFVEHVATHGRKQTEQSEDEQLDQRGRGSGSIAAVGNIVGVGWAGIPDELLAAADTFVDEQAFGQAIVVAQMACEVVVKRALERAFTEQRLPKVAEVIAEVAPTTALQDDSALAFYNTLTGDLVHKADSGGDKYWDDYLTMLDLRNKVAHGGLKPTADQAENSLNAAKSFVAHVVQHNKLEG